MPSFIIVRYVWQILGRGPFALPSHPWAAPKKHILNRVKDSFFYTTPLVAVFLVPKNMIINRNSNRRCSVRKGVLKNFKEFTGKHLCQNLFINKGLRSVTLLKKRLWHRCFPVNFARFLRTAFLKGHLRWLLLKNIIIVMFTASF